VYARRTLENASVDPERSGVGVSSANGSARALFFSDKRAAVRIRGTVAPTLGLTSQRSFAGLNDLHGLCC
jgi:hypothetical protein